ncbi:MAG: hypothetical protein WAN82_03565 [Candidatus Bathyarchaeia archaeon]
MVMEEFQRAFEEIIQNLRGWTWISGEKKWAPIYYFSEEWFNNMKTDWWE